MNLKPILNRILEQYSLPLSGYHGVAHWARVLENALKLAKSTGADTELVSLFAVLHDSQRLNENSDPMHGPRAAEFAETLRGSLIHLPDDSFDLLFVACRDHTHTRTHHDITIQTCWDADRLDLGRVGVKPLRSRLCTAAAKCPEMLQWSNARARSAFVPNIVATRCGLSSLRR